MKRKIGEYTSIIKEDRKLIYNSLLYGDKTKFCNGCFIRMTEEDIKKNKRGLSVGCSKCNKKFKKRMEKQKGISPTGLGI